MQYFIIYKSILFLLPCYLSVISVIIIHKNKRPGQNQAFLSNKNEFEMSDYMSFIGFIKRKYTIVQLPRTIKIVATILEIAKVDTPVTP